MLTEVEPNAAINWGKLPNRWPYILYKLKLKKKRRRRKAREISQHQNPIQKRRQNLRRARKTA